MKVFFNINNDQNNNIYLSNGLKPNIDIKWIDAENEYIKIKGIKRKVIDFTSGILVNALGYKNKFINRALKSQINKGILHSYHYQTEVKNKYLKALHDFTYEIITHPKIYLTSSGTEATETCLKLILKYGMEKTKKRNKILTIQGNYHGRTMGSSLMSNGSLYKDLWPEINQFFPKIKFPYTWQVKEQDGEKFFLNQIKQMPSQTIESISGILIESFQGWGACQYPKSFIKAIADFCKRKDILFCFDEMQAGFYRTGKKFEFENYDVSPDIICIGKGMGGGLPLSGLIGKSNIMDLASAGELSSTHSCNPLSCAAGLSVIESMSK